MPFNLIKLNFFLVLAILLFNINLFGQSQNFIHQLSVPFNCTSASSVEFCKQISNDSIAIVGLGEFTHGGHEPIAYKSELVKFLISQKSFRKLLVEFPNVTLISLNNYLIDSSKIDTSKLVSIVDDSFGQAIRDTSFLSLIRWLKMYNYTHQSAVVTVKGIDIEGEAQYFSSYVIHNLLIYLDEKSGRKLLEDTKKKPLDSILEIELSWIDQNRELVKKTIGNDKFNNLLEEIKMVKLSLEHDKLKKIDSFKAAKFRDSIMSILVTSSATSKSILWSHNMHITTSSTSISMGNYLKRTWGNRYFTILTDFSGESEISVPVGFRKYNLKSYKSNKNSIPYILRRRFKIKEGIVSLTDLKKNGISPSYNEIDADGNYRIVGNDSPFNFLVFFDIVHPLRLY